MHAFFAQRNKDRAAGVAVSDTATAAKVFGSPTPAVVHTAAAAAVGASQRTFHVAVQGCCHGELSRIYAACAEHEQLTGKRVDLLICCGDFQSVRDAADLGSMAVPQKYLTVGDFPKYYHPMTSEGGRDGGTATSPAHAAPYLTLFVGGNHENSDWLAEESYGGFVAPNIYYLGHSGVVEIDGVLRVGGLSGIFKAVDYTRPYPEQRPYATHGESGKRSAYHVRKIEIDKLTCFSRALRQSGGESDAAAREAPTVDIMVSHDWPAGITKYGNEEQLLRYKPFFRDEVEHNALGNPHTLPLLRECRPQYWVSAHLHCLFRASVPLPGVSPAPSTGSGRTTQFLALDKCAKGKGFLEFIDVPVPVAVASSGAAESSAEGGAPRAAQATERRQEEEVLGQERVRRDRVWLEVLRGSHAYLARNHTAPVGGNSGDGFDVEREASRVARRVGNGASVATDPSGDAEEEARAARAPTTASLLSALHMQPALPLQLPLTSRRYGQSAAQFGQPTAVSVRVGNGVTPRHQPPSTSHGRQHGARADEHASSAVLADPSTSTVSARVTGASPMPTLGWAEDLGGGSS